MYLANSLYCKNELVFLEIDRFNSELEDVEENDVSWPRMAS
jgi:hypothetical protein